MNVIEKVEQHHNLVQARYPNYTVIFTSLYGSQNYGLDNKDSDIDTCTFILPPFLDFIRGVPAVNNEFDAEDVLKRLPNYSKMSDKEKTELMLPYVQTSLAVNEMINLEYEIVNNKVKLKERTGMRKDRFSSIQYNNAVVQELNTKLKPKNVDQDIIDRLIIRPARRAGAF